MPTNLSRTATNSLIIGSISAVTSMLAALIGGRSRMRQGLAPLNAVSHIAWGGPPPAHSGKGNKNTWMGFLLHAGASVFWAAIFEAVFGRSARRGAGRVALGSAATAVTAYVTDYYIVSKRFRPGYEAYLSRKSMFAVYAALAAGIAFGAALTRVDRHQGDDR
jgi:hypothetical protein